VLTPVCVLQIDQQIEQKFMSVKRVVDVAKPLSNMSGLGVAGGAGSAQQLQKLEMARKLAARINMQRNLGEQAQDITQQAAIAILKGGVAAPQVSVGSSHTGIVNKYQYIGTQA
jgi:ATP-dependent RNA helicase DDX46/PRP5